MSFQFGLAEEDINKINSIFFKHSEITKVIIYGSRAKGDFKASSDIDLSLVTEKKDVSFLFKIENELDDLLLPYKIDLSIYSLIDNDNLKDHINRIGQVFFKR